MPTHSSPAVRILLVDDSKLVRHGLRFVLGASEAPALEVIGEASTLQEAREIAARTAPDLVLLEARLPDGNGVDACASFTALNPKIRIIILTAFASEMNLYRAIVAGAHGWLRKDVDPASLLEAIRDVMAGGVIVDDKAAAAGGHRLAAASKSKSTKIDTLSTQQARILELVATGKTNIEIARKLQLSPNTVRNYLVAIFVKLGVSRRSHATALYIESRAQSHALPSAADSALAHAENLAHPAGRSA